MAKVARLGRVERRKLIREGTRWGDVHGAMRCRIVALLARGDAAKDVAESLDVARSTVVLAAQRFVEGGLEGLLDRRGRNGARKVDDRFCAHLVTLLRRTPEHFGWPRPTWTRELLAAQMAEDGFVEVSVATMGRALARVGARLGRPKPIVLCPWPRDARLARLAEIRALEASATAKEPVLYVDEVDIHLNPRIGRDWMLRGEQRRILTPGKNKKFYVAGALDVRSGALVTTGLPKKNATLFCALLRCLDARYPAARRLHLVLDNYVIHSAVETQAELVTYGDRFVLHFLPPYCPDANRIERVWQDLHAHVTRNHRCRSLRALLAKAAAYLCAYRWRRASEWRLAA